MKNYNNWTNASDDSFDKVYDLYEKNTILINDSTTGIECVVDNANEWQENVDYIFLIKKDKGSIKWGDYLSYNSFNYLVNFSVEDRGYYWAAKSRLCNSTFSVPNGETKTQIGTDSMNRPVYDIVPNPPIDLPCIISKPTFTIDNQQVINTVDGKLHIQLPYSTAFIDNVTVGYQFTFPNDKFNKYQIEGIDLTQTVNDSGVIQVYADKV